MATDGTDHEGVLDRLQARERYVLHCLSQHGRMALPDLADEVVVWETKSRLPELPPGEARTVYLSLYHTHVPRLERHGLVRHAAERDLVWLDGEARELDFRKPSRPEAPT